MADGDAAGGTLPGPGAPAAPAATPAAAPASPAPPAPLAPPAGMPAAIPGVTPAAAPIGTDETIAPVAKPAANIATDGTLPGVAAGPSPAAHPAAAAAHPAAAPAHPAGAPTHPAAAPTRPAAAPSPAFAATLAGSTVAAVGANAAAIGAKAAAAVGAKVGANAAAFAATAAGSTAGADAAHSETLPAQGGDTDRDGGRGGGGAHAATLPGGYTVADLPSLPRVDDQTYAIGVEIARGGMGKILSARDRRLRRDVVIKVMKRDGGMIDPRFEREALITARLQHPSIVRVYDAGVLGDGRAFYAMERVRGRSLEAIIAESKTLAERMALLPHAIAVCDAIAYAHSESVLHRDLKPSNVLIGPFGETVVIDWGLAKEIRDEDGQLASDS
ncbi:MAG TPA: protein kinase, partial [Kofleriaceae bacterium]|nr:protein kinase [Kofleriaceae bacterium]